jgi:hypothetical protein
MELHKRRDGADGSATLDAAANEADGHARGGRATAAGKRLGELFEQRLGTDGIATGEADAGPPGALGESLEDGRLVAPLPFDAENPVPGDSARSATGGRAGGGCGDTTKTDALDRHGDDGTRWRFGTVAKDEAIGVGDGGDEQRERREDVRA